MDKTTKSATISQLIDMLRAVKSEYGDKEVVLSSDPEGNGYGTVGSSEVSVGVEGDLIILYPFEQFTDF